MIKKTNVIEKRNILNELRCNNMQLQELRFFTIYLSKINAREPEKTRTVKFLVEDFTAIMGIKKAHISELKKRTDSLLQKLVHVPIEGGGWSTFQLFKECTIYKVDNDWYVSIDAHDKALPLMFDFKKDYFTYELWNALRLSSSNQIRMYELLKCREKIGTRIFSITELKSLLFISDSEYPLFSVFKRDVIDVCKGALSLNTDIKFEYELIKKGRGGKVVSIKFIIYKNKDFVDQLTLNDFINLNKLDCEEEAAVAIDASSDSTNRLLEKDYAFFISAFDDEFNINQVKELYQLSVNYILYQPKPLNYDIAIYDYMRLKYAQLNVAVNVKFRYNYLKKLFLVELE